MQNLMILCPFWGGVKKGSFFGAVFRVPRKWLRLDCETDFFCRRADEPKKWPKKLGGHCAIRAAKRKNGAESGHPQAGTNLKTLFLLRQNALFDDWLQ